MELSSNLVDGVVEEGGGFGEKGVG